MPTPPPTPEEKGKTLSEELKGHDRNLTDRYPPSDFTKDDYNSEIVPGWIYSILKERDAIHSKHYARIEGEKDELVEVLGALYQEYCSVMHSEFDYSSADWSPERDNDEVAIRARDLLAKHTTSSPQGK